MTRKVLQLSDRVFNCNRLPYEVIPVVVDILGSVYPEMQTKLNDIFTILRNEEEIINSLRGSFGGEVKAMLAQYETHPEGLEESDFFDNIGLLPALRDFREAKRSFPIPNVFPDEYVMRLYDTFGLDEEIISRMGRLENVQLGEMSFQRAKSQLTKKGKDAVLRKQMELYDIESEDTSHLFSEDYPATDDSGKYEYIYKSATGAFAVDPVISHVLAIVVNNKLVSNTDKIQPEDKISLLLDKTNCYCESGGQDSDSGKIVSSLGVTMDISNVQDVNGRIWHSIENFNANDKRLSVGDGVRVSVNSDRRTGNTIHHTSTHLLNMAVRRVMQTVVYQKGSSVKEDGLRLDLGIIGSVKLDRDNIKMIEQQISDLIAQGCPVSTSLLQYDDIASRNDIMTVPGEIYPEDNLRLIAISSDQFQSLELCCGTHVKDVSQLKHFCITNVKLLSRGTYQITAVAGEAAHRAIALGETMRNDVVAIQSDLKSGKEKVTNLEGRVHRLKSILQQGFQKNFTMPFVAKSECLDILNVISKEIRDASRESLKEFIEIEMSSVLLDRPKSEHPFIVHNLNSSALMEEVKLQKATRLCTDRPILVMCVSGSQMKARACVPASMASDKFNAQRWLEEVAFIFKASVAPPKGQDAKLVCNMKTVKVKTTTVEEQIEGALKRAHEFAEENML